VTFETLAKHKIPYDELLFGKPAADAYIDGKAINSRIDTEKELGWESESPDQRSYNCVPGSVPARAFNVVRPLDEKHVAKTGPADVMRGELHWYHNIPASLTDLFPTPVEMSESGSRMGSIVMTRIDGVPFSHLLVNLCITPVRLKMFLTSLTRIHCCQSAGAVIPAVSEVDLYANLKTKIIERYDRHKMLYNSFSVSDLGVDVEDIFGRLLEAVTQYETCQRATLVPYIHGDPVFSNALLRNDGGVSFLDMRGALGDKLTTCGDLTYDLAKVYQSLWGYDFFLQDKEIHPEAQHQLQLLQRIFWSHVAEHYSNVRHADVCLLTASHYFSMVPLHEVRSRMQSYLRTAHVLLMQGLG